MRFLPHVLFLLGGLFLISGTVCNILLEIRK